MVVVTWLVYTFLFSLNLYVTHGDVDERLNVQTGPPSILSSRSGDRKTEA
jgi:hypothetical protein